MLTASAEAGLIDQQEYFQKRVASHNLSHYYLLERGDFAYNHSSSGNAVLGIIKRLDAYDSGCLSTLYIVFHPKRDIDSDYLLHYFESSAWHGDVAGMVTEGARNHGLLNISPDTFFTAR
ncbi:restriction endonuclease subunit S, partial [Bifidobacterium apri]